MSKITYRRQRFSSSTRELIDHANTILAELGARGYTLTVRQLYYQLVSRDLLTNNTKSYKRLVSILTDARLAGLVDWDALEDRTRNLHRLPTWDGPAEIVRVCADQFRHDLWADQKTRVEVWVEKEALAGVFEAICDPERLPLLSCRGYTSISELHVAARRLAVVARKQSVLILHFGDHDPSGLDMSRDIIDRLDLLRAGTVEVRRLALTRGQVDEYQPPPNPAKTTDSRYEAYQAVHGDESWELDALDPDVLRALVLAAVGEVRDRRRWIAAQRREEEAREELGLVAGRWDQAVEALSEYRGDEDE